MRKRPCREGLFSFRWTRVPAPLPDSCLTPSSSAWISVVRLPVVDLVGQCRGSREERCPDRERRRADRVVDERADPLLDVLPFECENHEAVAEVNRMPREAEIRQVERRARSDELGGSLLRAVPQLQRDDQPLHGPIISVPLACRENST